LPDRSLVQLDAIMLVRLEHGSARCVVPRRQGAARVAQVELGLDEKERLLRLCHTESTRRHSSGSTRFFSKTFNFQFVYQI
jgi:hypothetical protein